MSSGTSHPADGRSVRPPDAEPHGEPGGTRPRRSRLRGSLLEIPLLMLIALALALVIKTFLVQPFYIPSASMQDTLLIDDRVLVEKVSFRFRDPERGEVIVFRRPGAEESRSVGDVLRSFVESLGLVAPESDLDLIKRVIGLPGETIEIIGGVVHVNGVPIDEPYVRPDGRDFPPFTVPDGQYFMLGDNRGNSDDSRYSLGTVPRDGVVGRAFLILWPPSRATFRLDVDYPGVPDRAGEPADR